MVGSDRFPLPGLRTGSPSSMSGVGGVSFLPGSESRQGCLVLVLGPRRQRLQVSVYAKTLDPFVVFYPDKKHCRHCGVLKLRGCRVEPLAESETDFRVIPKSGDGGRVMVLGAESRADREDWLRAFAAPCPSELGAAGRPRSVSLRQQRMPSLPEIDEICSDSSDLEEVEEEEDDDEDEDAGSCHGLEGGHQSGSSSKSRTSAPSSSHSPRLRPRSRHEFLHNLDKFGRRPRCSTVHTSSPSSPVDCDAL